MNTGKSRTIIFIHGLFYNASYWDAWVNYFKSSGYRCYTPVYPFHEGNPAELRKKPDPKLAQVTLGDVVNTIALFIDALPEKPILVGHSMGGLVVQKLISMNKGVAGVCIGSAPPKGIFSFKWSFLKSNLPLINPFKGNSICLPDIEWFKYAVFNLLSSEQAVLEYEKYVVPESRNIPRGSTGKDGKINFNEAHAPLLFIVGEKDQIIPSGLNDKNFRAYKDGASRTDFKLFKDRTHHICGEKNWEEVANYISEWLKDSTAKG